MRAVRSSVRATTPHAPATTSSKTHDRTINGRANSNDTAATAYAVIVNVDVSDCRAKAQTEYQERPDRRAPEGALVLRLGRAQRHRPR